MLYCNQTEVFTPKERAIIATLFDWESDFDLKLKALNIKNLTKSKSWFNFFQGRFNKAKTESPDEIFPVLFNTYVKLGILKDKSLMTEPVDEDRILEGSEKITEEKKTVKVKKKKKPRKRKNRKK